MAKHTKRFTEGMLDEGAIMRALDIRSGLTVVDAGCGSGYMSMLFQETVGPDGMVYALDVNPQFVKEVRAEVSGGNIRVLEADIARRAPLEDHCADRMYIATVLHSLRRGMLDGVAREAARLLKPGGLLGVVEFDKVDTPYGPPECNRYSPEELRAALPFTPLHLVYVAEHFYLQVFTA